MQRSWSLPRRRTFLACNACKSKKSRCDGGRPNCERCVKLGRVCVYTLNDRDERMAQRNTWVARQQEPYRDARPADTAATTLSQTLSSPIIVNDRHSDAPTTTASNESPRTVARKTARERQPRSDEPANTPLSESLADVLATNAFDQSSNDEVGYFGSSTNHGFFWCLSGAIANLGYKEARYHTQQPTSTVDTRSNRRKSSKQDLPHRGATRNKLQYPSHEELVARFFDTISVVLPYVDEQSVMNKLHLMRENENSSDPSTQSWQALISIILAYALYTLDGPSPEPFYRRVVRLLYGTAVHLSTLQTLQALVLLSSFEQNIRRSMASLSSHALAVRTAYHLGIHAPPTYAYIGSKEKKLRARLWLAITSQDRILSACLGRPCLVAMNHVRPEIAKIIVDSDTSEADGGTLASNYSAAFFSLLTSLHEITGHALDKIYLSNIGSVRDLSKEQLLSEVLHLSLKLDTWKNSNNFFGIMRADVGFGSWVPPSEEAERLAIALSLHYHRIVLLVHGGIVMRSLEWLSITGENFLSGIAGDTIMSLLRRDLPAARDTHYVICEILQRRGFSEHNALWWICNYSAFTLSLHSFGLWVLSSHITDARPDGIRLQKADTEDLLQSALRNLRTMGGVSMLSSKAYRRLQSLFNLLQDKESTSNSILSPQESRDAFGDGLLSAPQGSSWIGQQLETTNSPVANYMLPSLEEYGPDALYGFLGHQDPFGYQDPFGFGISDMDYDFSNVIGGQSTI
ncbi:hypothetical protein OIDMADRAFT_56705 [Oidiodendron maius Zn]|uniref:Zn(2)-C6 fungal-type domain-containing protein n=1 Tax=Oidiodendron maius (strain Zn) TaxID=913774 RepID=A0A0C3GQM0_OIDMZ|nr:hypothetical protein OIDMADRAFT_56705 [Oidiodendron maius Zn]